MDFSQVKSLTIPEGEVTKITDSSGRVLWQKESGSWQTIWEGNKTCKATNSGYSGNENNFAQTISGTGYTPKIRITFSLTAVDSSSSSNKGSIDYYINNKSGTAAPESPITIDALNEPSSTNTLLGSYIWYDNYRYRINAALTAVKDTNNNRIKFNLYADFIQPSYGRHYGEVTLKITKIEQYIDN